MALQWLVGQSCTSTCAGSDPTTDTVKFDPSSINTEDPPIMDEQERELAADLERQCAEEAERQRAEEAERQRLEELTARREREFREQKERAHLQKERAHLQRERAILQWEKEEEEERLCLEHQRQEEAAALIEAERRENARLEAEARAHQEEQAARLQLDDWLKKNNYTTANTKKSKMLKTRYPLHDATSQCDAAAVRLLLRFGADPALKNSSNHTPQQLAEKTKGGQAVLAVFKPNARVKVGGA